MLDDEHTRSSVACSKDPAGRKRLGRRPKSAAARQAAPGRKTGRSEQAQQAAHSTAALAVDDAVFAVCERYGIVRCATARRSYRSRHRVLGRALAARRARRLSGCLRRFSAGSFSICRHGGVDPRTLSDSTIAQLRDLVGPGMAVENPLDVGGHRAANPEVLREIRTAIINDPGVDLLLVLGELPLSADMKAMPEAFAGVADTTDKPVIATTRVRQNVTEIGRAFLSAARIPFVMGMRESTVVVKALTRYAAALRNGRREPAQRPPVSPFAPGTTWDEQAPQVRDPHAGLSNRRRRPRRGRGRRLDRRPGGAQAALAADRPQNGGRRGGRGLAKRRRGCGGR